MLFETMNMLPPVSSAGNARVGISLIGQSAPAAALRRMVTLSAATDAPLMLTGAAGSGRRDIAGAVHAQSDRSAAGFVAIHCATIDQAMLSGGLLDSASGGSVFFDEIGELPSLLHNHLYHLLEDRNLRIISATSETADRLKHDFGMAAELYASLSVLTLPVPVIRRRKADIALLLEAHIQQLPKDKRYTFDNSAKRALGSYDWPGNLDEMRELVGRLSKSHARQRVGVNQLPAAIRMLGAAPESYTRPDNSAQVKRIEAGFNLQDYLAAEEIKYIKAALQKSGGVIQRAANMTGIKRTTFLAKMKKHGIEAK